MIRWQLKKQNALFIIVISMGLISCGQLEMQKDKELTAAELATKSDDFICKRADRMAVLREITPLWIRELKKRKLEECMAALYRGK